MPILIEVKPNYVAPLACQCEIVQRPDGWYRKLADSCAVVEHDDDATLPVAASAVLVDTTPPPVVCCTEIVVPALMPPAAEPASAPLVATSMVLRPSISLYEYLDLPAINFSTLKYMDKSPQHYQWAVNVGREDTTALMKFRAIHTAVLEPDEFDKRYVVFPGKTRRGKAWDAFCAEHPGCEIIKADEREKILNMAEAIWEHPVAGEIFAEGEAERAITWIDPRTGLACKARLDWWSPCVLTDLKSGPVNARIFGALAAKLLYHAQLAWYSDALALDTGYRPPVKFIVAEPEPPHAVGVFGLGEDERAIGRETYEGWLDRVVECERRGAWPGPYPNEEALVLPRYAYGDDEMEDGTSVIVEDDDAEDE